MKEACLLQWSIGAVTYSRTMKIAGSLIWFEGDSVTRMFAHRI